MPTMSDQGFNVTTQVKTKGVTESQVTPDSQSYRIPEASDDEMAARALTDVDHVKLSRDLSDVMADIGVTYDVITARRKTFLDEENVDTFVVGLLNRDLSYFYFGSQSEGTTTVGLHSDIDQLKCFQGTVIIRDISEWQIGHENLLLKKTDFMAPGYRSLIPLQEDSPTPLSHVSDEDKDRYVLYDDGVIYSRHTYLHRGNPGGVMHGPAWASKGSGGWPDEDWVCAYYSPHWLDEGKAWLQRTSTLPWPTAEMKDSIVQSGCFVVPVGHKQSVTSAEIQYRLSTNLAERILMFDLNLTQVRCLILLKMLMRTHLNTIYEDCMKSYYCKTALLYTVEQTENNDWDEQSFLSRTVQCIKWLLKCIENNSIPHYIKSSLDILEGRLNVETRTRICDVLKTLIDNPMAAILKVAIDDLGKRVHIKCGGPCTNNLLTYEYHKRRIGWSLSRFYVENFPFDYNVILKEDDALKTVPHIRLLKSRISICDSVDVSNCHRARAATRFKLLFCTTLGSIMASQDLLHRGIISDEAFNWLESGAESDLTSGKLKFATVLYCTSYLERAVTILTELEKLYDRDNVEPVCLCYRRTKPYEPRKGFVDNCIERINSNTLQKYVAYCVVFTQNEDQCVPEELRYEMARRVTQYNKGENTEIWMNWACVDSLPYLYFLLYQTHRKLGNCSEKALVLRELHGIIETESFHHKETAYNLLGQCYEKENMVQEAMDCYHGSLKERSTNNVAGTHLERPIAKARK